MHAETLPLEDQVLPQMYKGKEISKDEAKALLEGKLRRRKQVNGLIYHELQCPSGDDNNGWKIVLRKPSRKKKKSMSSFKIMNDRLGKIIVEFIHGGIPDKIQAGVNYFLSNHAPVRNIPFEQGIMAAIGRKVDVRTSCLSLYRSEKKGKEERISQSKLHMERCAVELKTLLMASICSTSIEKELDVLEWKGNILKIPSAGKEVRCLPTMCVSESLSNSLHIDYGDGSRSFAIFYQRRMNKGKSYFVIPSLGLAIEMFSVPVIISWDGGIVKIVPFHLARELSLYLLVPLKTSQ